MGTGPTHRLLSLLSPERGRCAVVAALMAASVLGEVAVPYFTGRVTDWVASEDEVAAALPMVLLGLSSAVTEFACDVTYTGTLSRVLGRLQRRVFAAVLRRDIADLQVTGTGAVTARVTGDVEAAHAAVAEALSLLLWYLARGLCLLVTMAWLSPPLAFVTVLSLPVLLLLPRTVGKIQEGLARQVQEALASATEVATETFQAMATVRSFAYEAGAAERHRQRLQRLYRLEARDAAAYAAGLWASGFSALTLKLGLLCYGARLVALGTITTGDLVTFLIYQMQFTEAVEVLLRYYPNMTKAVGSSEKIFEFLEQEQVTPMGTLAPDVLRGHLQLEDVWFSYPGHQEPVLKGVSLALRPGAALAVLAPAGAGKSTLASLVLNLRPPARGRVLLDGHPLPAYRHRYLRRQVAAVPQEPVLFSRSLHDNIAYGPGTWNRAQVTVAARRAGAHDFITRLPQGYDTAVGALGGQLSGGQRQAVAIARAVLRNPSVLVLDEPTSALDVESCVQVEQELFGAGGAGRAVLLLTGQVPLALRAPRVAVLAGGRLHELGSPGELLRPGSRYWHLLGGGGQGGTAGDGDSGEGGEGQRELGMGTPDAKVGTPRDGDTRSQDGDTGDMDGDSRNRDGDTGDMDGDMKSRDGDTRNSDGDSGDMDGDMKSRDGVTRNSDGDTGDMDGDMKSNDGDTRSQDGDTGDMDGDMKSNDGDTRNSDGDSGDMDGDMKSNDGDTRNSDGDTGSRDGDMKSRDGDSGDMDGDMKSRDGDTRSQDGDTGDMDGDTEGWDGDNGGWDRDTRNGGGDTRDRAGDAKSRAGDTKDGDTTNQGGDTKDQDGDTLNQDGDTKDGDTKDQDGDTKDGDTLNQGGDTTNQDGDTKDGDTLHQGGDTKDGDTKDQDGDTKDEGGDTTNHDK